jgi:hypothetical protein
MDSIAQAIQAMSGNNDGLIAKVCKVANADVLKMQCDLLPIDGSATFYEVPYNAHVQDKGLVNHPKNNSYVVAVLIGKHRAMICNVSQLDKQVLQIGQVEWRVDITGFLLKKENETLKILMADLIAAIKAMRFTTNQGPTIELINKAQFEALETRFNYLLK